MAWKSIKDRTNRDTGFLILSLQVKGTPMRQGLEVCEISENRVVDISPKIMIKEFTVTDAICS